MGAQTCVLRRGIELTISRASGGCQPGPTVIEIRPGSGWSAGPGSFVQPARESGLEALLARSMTRLEPDQPLTTFVIMT
jgi:hypothetical protein